MTHATIDDTDFILLYVPRGQSIEIVLEGSAGRPTVTGSQSIRARSESGTVIITGNPSGVSLVRSGSAAILIADKSTAQTFWNPHISTGPGSTFDLSPDTPSVLVSGPYLVRNVTIFGSTLALVGDTDGPTPITVIAPSSVSIVTWNGARVDMSQNPLGVGLRGVLTTRVPPIRLPSLRRLSWRSIDALPEIDPSFDDSEWVVADKLVSATSRPDKPYSGDKLLYADEYGTSEWWSHFAQRDS